jgi:hypothetical protein
MTKPPRTPLTFDIGAAPVVDIELERASAAPAAPKPDPVLRQQLGVRIPMDVYKRLRVKAVIDGVLVQDLVERAVRELLDREER